MNRSDIERLTDELIGEAVLSLLKRKAPVSSMALLTELRAMQGVERDPRRREAFPSIVAYIEAVTANKNEQKTPTTKRQHKESAQMMADGMSASGKGKIH